MAKTTRKYIEALHGFTQSMDNLVETLIEQEKAKGEEMDVLQEFFNSSTDMFKVVESISENVNQIREDVQINSNRSNEILSAVKALKDEKETGIFSKIEKESNKDSIVEGAKTIVLIAGAVLAIGASFKLIGEVDFASVLALSISLPLIAYAFVQIAEFGDLDYNTVLSIGLLLTIISTSIMLSSHILSQSARMSEDTILTTMTMSAVFGILAIGLPPLVEAFQDVSLKDILFLGLGIIVVSAAIAISSMILQHTVPIPFFDVLAATIAIGVVAIVGAIALYALTKLLNIKSALIGSLMLIVVSTSLMIASHIISAGNYENAPSIDWALGVGLSILMIAPTMIFLGIPAVMLFVFLGALMMPVVAASIVAVSHILSEGKYENYPTADWIVGTGVSMMLFAPAMLTLGFMGLFFPILEIGRKSMLTVARTIVDVADILGNADFSKGPSAEWAQGTGYALSSFMEAIALAQPSVWDMWSGNNGIEDKVANLKYAVLAMVGIAEYLGTMTTTGVFDPKKAPPKEWAEGVGISISKFMEALNMANEKSMWDSLSDFFGGDSLNEKFAILYKVTDTMVNIAGYLNAKSGSFKKGPSKAWAEGVGGGIMAFSKALNYLTSNDSALMFSTEASFDVLSAVARSMVNVGVIFTENSSAFAKGPSLAWTEQIKSLMLSYYHITEKLKDDNVFNTKNKMFEIAKTYVELLKMLQNVDLNDNTDPFIQASKGIDALANSFVNFASAIDKVGGTITNLSTDTLDLIRGVSLSMMALSVVDADNLDKVLSKLRPEDVAKMYEMSTKQADNRPKSNFSNLSSFINKGLQNSPQVNEVRKQTKELISIKQELIKLNTQVTKIVSNTDEMLDIKTTNSSSDDTRISH